MGIGPIELLRAHLERVHQALLAGNQEPAPSTALVGDIAQRFGFRSRGTSPLPIKSKSNHPAKR